jgi:hypothetical protein
MALAGQRRDRVQWRGVTGSCSGRADSPTHRSARAGSLRPGARWHPRWERFRPRRFSPLDLAIEALDRIGGVQLGAVLGREGHVGEHVGFGLVQIGRELGPQLIGDASPLSSGGFGIVLGEGGGDEGGDDTAALPAGMRQDVAHQVHATALPRWRSALWRLRP